MHGTARRRRNFTAAAAAAGLGCVSALPAMAAEWEISLGGYMEMHLGFASLDNPPSVDDGADFSYDADLILDGDITLDNGLTFGGEINLEGGRAGDDGQTPEIDEYFLFVRGSFGDILIGAQDSAGRRMHQGAPDVSLIGTVEGSPGGSAVAQHFPFIGTRSGIRYGSDYYAGTLGSTFIETHGSDQLPRITYFTPRFAGFQLGTSYAGDGGQTAPRLENLFDVGLNYAGSFGGTQLNVSGRWGTATDSQNGPNDPTVWGVGLNLGFGGVTIGGSWAEINDSVTGISDGRSYDVGAAYTTGPWSFSFTYFNGENIDNEHPVQFGLKENLEVFNLGINYKLAKGVGLAAFDSATIGAFAGTTDFNEDVGDGGFGTPGDNVDGFIIGTGILLSF